MRSWACTCVHPACFQPNPGIWTHQPCGFQHSSSVCYQLYQQPGPSFDILFLLQYSSDMLFCKILRDFLTDKGWSPKSCLAFKVRHNRLPCHLQDFWNCSCLKESDFTLALLPVKLCSHFLNSYLFFSNWLWSPRLWKAFPGHFCSVSSLCCILETYFWLVIRHFILGCFLSPPNWAEQL